MNGRFRPTYGDRFRSWKLRSDIPLITLHPPEGGLAQTAPDVASRSHGGSADWIIGLGLSLSGPSITDELSPND